MYDSIVVGAGVMGLCAAWELQHDGRTLLLDQFSWPHMRGSSSGHSRIYRTAYLQPEYAAQMGFSVNQWRQLETLTGRQLLHNCGLLAGGPSVNFAEYDASLRENGVSYEVLTTQEVAHRWPGLSGFDPNQRFIYDPSAGFIAADTALHALKDVFVQGGGDFRPCEKLQELRSKADCVEVITNRGVYRTKNVVLTAGPWNVKILQDLGVYLPLNVTKTVYAYFPVRKEAEHLFTPERYPTTVFKDSEKKLMVYGIPSFEFPGHVKFGMHAGVPCDPDRRDRTPYPRDSELRMRKYVEENFPQLEHEPSAVEFCMYTNTPDSGFVLDRVPSDRRIVFGTGFSGHGFKLGPFVGRILADLALDRKPTVDGSSMRMSRFAEKAKL